MTALWMVLGLIGLWLLVLIVRAVLFTAKEQPAPHAEPLAVDAAASLERFRALIRAKTISYVEKERMDAKEFEGFQELLPTLYPRVHEACTREKVSENGLLYRWPGKRSDAPSVLMAHYDVVPVNEEEWEEPPFDAVVKNGELWGRGTLDTKGTLMGALEAAELLIMQGFVPENDVYFAFGGDEEIMGEDAPSIVRLLEQRGVKPAFVLDEGGAIVENVFPGVKRAAALIGIAEKGSVSVDLTAAAKGGHASSPPATQSAALLARAIDRLSRKPMPFHLTKPARELFDVMGRHSSFAFKLIFANLWCFAPLLNLICKQSGGELNALVRTTCAFTRLKAADAYNVLPTQSTAGLNLRIISGDSIAQVKERMERTIGDERVRVSIVQGVEASAISKTYDEPWQRLDTAIRQTYPEVLVAPYLMLACSDSRHYGKLSDHVYRFSGMPLSKEQRGLIHNANERIPVGHIKDTILFFARVLKQC